MGEEGGVVQSARAMRRWRNGMLVRCSIVMEGKKQRVEVDFNGEGQRGLWSGRWVWRLGLRAGGWIFSAECGSVRSATVAVRQSSFVRACNLLGLMLGWDGMGCE